MARPPRDATGVLERAREQVENATDADALRAAQATLLPLLGLSLDATAEVVGRNRWWVSRARNRFLRGEPPAKQGGRRHSLVEIDEELELVKTAFKLRHTSWGHRDSVRQVLRGLLDKRTGSPVSDSAITDMLDRVAHRLYPGAKGSDLTQRDVHFARVWLLEDLAANRSEEK